MMPLGISLFSFNGFGYVGLLSCRIIYMCVCERETSKMSAPGRSSFLANARANSQKFKDNVQTIRVEVHRLGVAPVNYNLESSGNGQSNVVIRLFPIGFCYFGSISFRDLAPVHKIISGSWEETDEISNVHMSLPFSTDADVARLNPDILHVLVGTTIRACAIHNISFVRNFGTNRAILQYRYCDTGHDGRLCPKHGSLVLNYEA
jgi:hypothetical protein